MRTFLSKRNLPLIAFAVILAALTFAAGCGDEKTANIMDQPTEQLQHAEGVEAPVAESGEVLGATTGQLVYTSYALQTGFGARLVLGGKFHRTMAFLPVPVGQTYDPGLLMKDLIRELTKDGTLTGIDLGQHAKNRLLIISPGANPRRADMVMDSSELPTSPTGGQDPKE